MKSKLFVLSALFLLTLLLCGCSQGADRQESTSSSNSISIQRSALQSDVSTTSEDPSPTSTESADTQSIVTETPSAESSVQDEPVTKQQTLVVYFSRTGEQYGVGLINEGNTAIAAKEIALQTGADLFEILPEIDVYPLSYDALLETAKQEQTENARPKIKGDLPDLSQYSTIFIGAPVWWGDWPMIMYTFFESAELSGKKLIPFSTHAGSGLSGFDSRLASIAPNAEILTGLAILGEDCQNNRSAVANEISEWVKALGVL